MGYLLIDRVLDYCLLQVHVDLFWPYDVPCTVWDTWYQGVVVCLRSIGFKRIWCTWTVLLISIQIVGGGGVDISYPDSPSFKVFYLFYHWFSVSQCRCKLKSTTQWPWTPNIGLNAKPFISTRWCVHMDEKFTTGNIITNYQKLRRCCDMYVKEFMTLTLCRLVYAFFVESHNLCCVTVAQKVCAVFWCKSVSCEIRMIHVRWYRSSENPKVC